MYKNDLCLKRYRGNLFCPGYGFFFWVFLLVLSCRPPDRGRPGKPAVESTDSATEYYARDQIQLANLNFIPANFIDTPGGEFKQNQLRYPRVREAYRSKEGSMKRLLASKGINTFDINLFIRIFKKAQILEVWAKPQQEDPFVHVVDYPFCAASGSPGPKRREGDMQIPEGFYHISYFNPSSKFYLSLKLNYPNRSDRIKGNPRRPGSNIFIHGCCATIGCIPVIDSYIKELYVLAVEAHSTGNTEIPVHVFPDPLDGAPWEKLRENYRDNGALIDFWKNLRPAFLAFDRSKMVPEVGVDKSGDYHMEK